MWYDIQGRPVSTEEWLLLMQDTNYRIVGKTHGLFFSISTVLLGLDHSFWGGKPVIFETMVFTRWKKKSPSARYFGFKQQWFSDSVDEQRYSTLAQAKGGHIDMVLKWTGWPGFARCVAYWLGVEI